MAVVIRAALGNVVMQGNTVDGAAALWHDRPVRALQVLIDGEERRLVRPVVRAARRGRVSAHVSAIWTIGICGELHRTWNSCCSTLSLLHV